METGAVDKRKKRSSSEPILEQDKVSEITTIVSPEQKQRLVCRARKLSGIVLAQTEQTVEPNSDGYVLRNRQTAKNSQKPLSVKSTPKSAKKNKDKLSAISVNCRDIRAYIPGSVNALSPKDPINTVDTQNSTVKAWTKIFDNMAANNHDTEQHGKDSQAIVGVATCSRPAVQGEAVGNEDMTNNQLLAQIRLLLDNQKEEIQKSIQTVEVTATEAAEKVQALELTTKNTTDSVDKLEKIVTQVVEENKTMAATMIRQSAIIHELQSRVENLEQQKTKHNLIFYSITDAKDQSPMRAALDFIRNVLMPDQLILIQDAYRMGKYVSGKCRPLVMIFANANEKSKIYEYWKNMKGKKNAKGYKYKFKEQKPARMTEEDNRINEIKYKNRKKKTIAQRLELSIKKGQLYVGQEENKVKYEKLVHSPTVQEALQASDDVKQRLKKVKVGEGSKIGKKELYLYWLYKSG